MVTTTTTGVTKSFHRWLADVPALVGASTFARNLRTLDRSVRETIAGAADLPYNAMPGLQLTYTFSTGDPAIDEAVAIRELRAEAKRLTDEASARLGDAARQLVSRGLTVRDVAELLEISPQRVSQIAPRPQEQELAPSTSSALPRSHANESA